MLKLAIAMFAVALAGSASAAGWRSLRVDASSEAAFEQSLAEFKDKLSPARRYVFGEALKDIWIRGNQGAAAEQREYTEADYHRQLNGLSYKEVVTLMDPTGATARRYRAAYNPSRTARTRYGASAVSAAPRTWPPHGVPMRQSGPNWRGGTPLFGPGPPPR
jgi:hypothetical protein